LQPVELLGVLHLGGGAQHLGHGDKVSSVRFLGQVRKFFSSNTSLRMWPDSTRVPRSLKRCRNHGFTLCWPPLVPEPTGIRRAPDRWIAARPSKTSWDCDS